VNLLVKGIADNGIMIVICAVFICFTIIAFKAWLDNIKIKNEAMKVMSESLKGVESKCKDINDKFDILRDRFQITIANLLEAIYDNRCVSSQEFEMYCIALNGKYINKAMILIFTELDENSLNLKSRRAMLRDNSISIMSKSKSDIKHRILKIRYNVDKLDVISERYEDSYEKTIKSIKEELLDNLSYEQLKQDSMYLAFKSKIRNKLYNLNQELDSMIRENK